MNNEELEAIVQLKKYITEQKRTILEDDERESIDLFRSFVLNEDNKESQDITLETLISKLNSDINFLEKIKGDKGEDGSSVSKNELLESLKHDSEFLEKIKAPEISLDSIIESLKEDNEFLSKIRGEDGEDGSSVSLESIIDALIKNKEFIEKTKGKDGQDGQQYFSSGGLGEYDVIRLIQRYAGTGGGSFTGRISATNVDVDTSTMSVLTSAMSATSQELFEEIDCQISKKIIFGQYITKDVYEESGYTYVGAESPLGNWYIKRVEEVGDDIFMRYANLSNNPSIYTYENAISSRASLVYSLDINLPEEDCGSPNCTGYPVPDSWQQVSASYYTKIQVDQLISGGTNVDLSDYYTKLESVSLFLTLTSGGNVSADINIIDHTLTTKYLKLQTSGIEVPTDIGTFYFDELDQTVSIVLKNGSRLQLGQENVLYASNRTGSTILDGKMVYVDGSQGQRVTVNLPSCSAYNSHCTIAMSTQNILDNQDGYFTCLGLVRDIDTSTFSAGQVVWLGLEPGSITGIRPSTVDPSYQDVRVGYVSRSHNINGSILVTIQVLSKLEDITNVKILDINDGDHLVYESSTKTWKNKKVSHNHTQSIASSAWTITHNLGYKPIVQTWDHSDEQILGLVKYIDLSSCTVSFGMLVSGGARCV